MQLVTTLILCKVFSVEKLRSDAQVETFGS